MAWECIHAHMHLGMLSSCHQSWLWGLQVESRSSYGTAVSEVVIHMN